MSVKVHIDGQPVEQFASYRDAMAVLGPIPDESQITVNIWTSVPGSAPRPHDVVLNAEGHAAKQAWLSAGGAAISTERSVHGSVDRIRGGALNVALSSRVADDVNPGVFAAFLAHDIPLIDAWILARSFNGQGWPYDLADYPIPIGGPVCEERFPRFPRRAGLYAVVPTLDWVKRLCANHVPALQLRDKRPSGDISEAELRRVIQWAAESGSMLFINDHWKLAIDCNAYGVHLGQEDMDTANLSEIRAAGLRLGISTHSIYEMLRAHLCKPSYIAIGAIYSTATKTMPTLPQGLRRLRQYVRLMSPHYPLVAIGGINRQRIGSVWDTGVDCAAVLRAIVDAPDYAEAAEELLAMTPQLSSAHRRS